jgi:hypothetical protein
MIPVHEVSAVTAASLLHLACALGWLILLFLAIAGYGAALLRVWGYRQAGFTLSATVGFVPVIFIGGVLNLLQMVRPGVLIGFVLVGAALAAGSAWGQRNRLKSMTPAARSTLSWIVLTVAVLGAAFRVTATVHPSHFEPSDDLYFYYAAPVKMIEMHSYAADPYSERRITSSIGGNQFLNTLILATQPLETIQMADGGMGVILLFLLGLALAEAFELTHLQRYSFAFILMIMPQIRLNISYVILPSALFLGLVYLAVHRRLTQDYPLLQALLLGGVVGAVATMKSTYVTHGVLFILFLTLLHWRTRGLRAALRLLGVAAASCFTVMLPWIIASHQTCGTWFYPLLGKGVHFSAYGLYRVPGEMTRQIIFTKVIPFCLPLFILFLGEFVISEKNERSYSIVGLMLTGCIGSALVGMATGGDSLKRYNFACVLPAICLIFILCARRTNISGGLPLWRLLQAAAVTAITGLALTVGLSSFTYEYTVTWHSFKLAPHPLRLTNEALHQQYAAVERALPTDADALETVTLPFLFDYTKHNIFFADFPGDASPKPGWPARQSGEALAHFLLAHHIRYLIYGYGECGSPAPFATCEESYAHDDQRVIHMHEISAFIRGELESGYDARKQYGELARVKRHIYDDGTIYILDLAS